MTMYRKMKPALLIVSALILGVISASMAKADHNWKFAVRDHADEMIHTSIAIRQEILHVAKNSRVFGSMLSETGLMEGNAAILKGWTYHREACFLREQAEKVHENVHHLEALLAEARLRSDSGLDRRMPCTDELQRLIAIMEAHVIHTLGDIPGQVAFSPQPVVVQPFPVIDNRPNFGPQTTLQFGNNRPGFGGQSVQFAVGPRLNIQLNLGGSNRPPTFNNPSHQNHGQNFSNGNHHIPGNTGNHGFGNQGNRRSSTNQHNQHSGLHKSAITGQNGTNIYGGRAVVSQFANNGSVKRNQSASVNANRGRNHANHR